MVADPNTGVGPLPNVKLLPLTPEMEQQLREREALEALGSDEEVEVHSELPSEVPDEEEEEEEEEEEDDREYFEKPFPRDIEVFFPLTFLTPYFCSIYPSFYCFVLLLICKFYCSSPLVTVNSRPVQTVPTMVTIHMFSV